MNGSLEAKIDLGIWKLEVRREMSTFKERESKTTTASGEEGSWQCMCLMVMKAKGHSSHLVVVDCPLSAALYWL